MARIIIVDDSTYSRIQLKKILTNAGHEVTGEAATGFEAVSKYTLLKPDIVTMDITMPDMNGIDALQSIIKADPDAKVVMVTAMSQADKVLEALKAGAKNYITKPFDRAKIISVVNELAAQK
jgi:two-component system chemotaxis response regulator CheY